jgi:hypothetical protein
MCSGRTLTVGLSSASAPCVSPLLNLQDTATERDVLRRRAKREPDGPCNLPCSILRVKQGHMSASGSRGNTFNRARSPPQTRVFADRILYSPRSLRITKSPSASGESCIDSLCSIRREAVFAARNFVAPSTSPLAGTARFEAPEVLRSSAAHRQNSVGDRQRISGKKEREKAPARHQ